MGFYLTIMKGDSVNMLDKNRDAMQVHVDGWISRTAEHPTALAPHPFMSEGPAADSHGFLHNLDGQSRRAFEIGCKAYEGKFRSDGVTPYFSHPVIVGLMIYMAGLRAAVPVALLHEVLDNTDVTPDELRDYGLCNRQVQAIIRLTKVDKRHYLDYYRDVLRNRLATAVKVADIVHNMSRRPTVAQIKRNSQFLAAALFGAPLPRKGSVDDVSNKKGVRQ